MSCTGSGPRRTATAARRTGQCSSGPRSGSGLGTRVTVEAGVACTARGVQARAGGCTGRMARARVEAGSGREAVGNVLPAREAPGSGPLSDAGAATSPAVRSLPRGTPSGPESRCQDICNNHTSVRQANNTTTLIITIVLTMPLQPYLYSSKAIKHFKPFINQMR